MKKISTWICSALVCAIIAWGKENVAAAGPGTGNPVPDTNAPKPPATVAECRKCIVLSEQLHNRVAIADVVSGQVFWEWRPEQSNVQPQHLAWFTNTSDAKPVYCGQYLLVTASGGGVALVRIADKKTVFYAYAGGNTHSAELLPDGNIVSASSTGNFMMLFRVDTTSAPEAVYSRKYPLPFGHNVVWDQQRQVLWSAADHQLLSFTYNFNCSQPELVQQDAVNLPGKDAHDLFPVYGQQALWLTNTNNVYIYYPDTQKMEQYGSIQANIKSVSSGGDDLPVIIIRPKTSWWTDEVIDEKGNTVFYQPGLKIYKARWYLENAFSYPAVHEMKQCP
ncbi:DUF6528 family protein [Chitinophaga japonensis]|uniref:PQQ enzyme-like repeat protein n=1 Tax=Chitinophaga japonensis TaxID=104662 RepID=A0A562T5K0_CHIJA|nr:DUF6528 family protein [Chitinophaga japonensis]TWI88805.1 hypothetical protein LX66_2891 [Chitinophaga japonensis]